MIIHAPNGDPAIVHGSRVNGPGIRSVIWVQGCGILCPGCQNPKTHAFAGGLDFTPEVLAARVVKEAEPGTEGITISGGEPMHQALSVFRFICMIRALRPDWTVGMFTGYTLRDLMYGEYDLRERHPIGAPVLPRLLWEHQIQPSLHFLIAGPFDAQQPPELARPDLPYRHAIASANQQIHLFTRRYQYSDFPELAREVLIDADGLTQITGYSV